ncbi:MAG TPA: hypothetical protein VE890_06700, partial [Thermoguttaceae bacterium]|nr:hypothetical protein [Thermoguttaceae bacterium]
MSNLLGRLAIPAALALASLGPSVSYAQPEPPNVHYVFPPGGQRGQTFEAIIGGERLLGAEAVRISGQGVTIELIEVKEPDPDEKPDPIKRPVVVVKRDTARIKVTIAADAPLGSRDVRIVSPNGVSNRHRFLVGEIPELNELEPNESQAEAQQIASLPVTVNGQLIEGDVDFVRFEAKAG